jgi:hypothetical protein
MPSGGGQAGAPETVLAGGGGTARFDGARLRIVRGRTTWTVPVEVLAAAEVTPRGAVRIVLGGTREDAARAGHGLGTAVELPAPDVRAAEAFRRSVAVALTHRGPRPRRTVTR